MTYPSYQQFYENVVAPLKLANPHHHRLDGWETGGNRRVAGTFRHAGRTWLAHADSRFEPLELAYHAMNDLDEDPFVSAPTENGHRLDLRADLQLRRGTRHRHLYIYSVRE